MDEWGTKLALHGFKEDILRSSPESQTPQSGQIFASFQHSQEMIASQLAHLAGETGAAVRNEDFGLTHAARVKQYLTSGWMTGMIFEGHTQIESSQGNPNSFATPADMNDFVGKRQQFPKSGTGLRGTLFFQSGGELVRTGFDAQDAHDGNS
jgi:hypothetical protein